MSRSPLVLGLAQSLAHPCFALCARSPALRDKGGVARPEKTGIKRPKINPHERGNI